MTSKRSRQRRASAHLEQVNLYAAGVDIGSKSHFVAVAADLDDEPVREFAVFTADLRRMADWLIERGITTVAMESTGVYWIPVYELLEERGLAVVLVDGRHVRNLPGRKSDVLDCQWLQQLHTYGLLRGAFRPPEYTVVLRAYLRQRDTLIAGAADAIRRMQKALRQMNLLLDNVVSDITGNTGMAIIGAILDGERDPAALAALRDGRCRQDAATIAASLEGNYRDEHLFVLRQCHETYTFHRQQIQACERAIKAHLQAFDAGAGGGPGEGGAPPRKKSQGHSKNALSFEARDVLYRMTGVDLTEVTGLSETSVLQLLSETGTDMTRWPSAKHFASWLGLSPGSKITGGKALSTRTKPSANRAAAVFRMAAYAQGQSRSATGAFYRRLRARCGAPKAITATAHKLARIFYSMLTHRTPFEELGQDYYEQRYRERVTAQLKRRAAEMGFELHPAPSST